MFVTPKFNEQWFFDGVCYDSRPDVDEDVLYISPLMKNGGEVKADLNAIHSLIIDNNVLSDLLGDRRPEFINHIDGILRTEQIELNPTFALIEQRQKYEKASEALIEYANILDERYGWFAAKIGLHEFEACLELHKASIVKNISLLSGYLSVITYLYHLNGSAKEKLTWLSAIVVYNDLPIFQLHFYFAALVFLSKESPELFSKKDIKKIRDDLRLEGDFDKQDKKIRNISNDLALPTLALFPDVLQNNRVVFPYVATRDRLVQLFLSQVNCKLIVDAGNGRANGAWELQADCLLETHLGDHVVKSIPKREIASSKDTMSVRKSQLDALLKMYIEKCVSLKSIEVV